MVLYTVSKHRQVVKKLGYRLVFQHTSRCFDTGVKNAFSFFIYYVENVTRLVYCRNILKGSRSNVSSEREKPFVRETRPLRETLALFYVYFGSTSTCNNFDQHLRYLNCG